MCRLSWLLPKHLQQPVLVPACKCFACRNTGGLHMTFSARAGCLGFSQTSPATCDCTRKQMISRPELRGFSNDLFCTCRLSWLLPKHLQQPVLVPACKCLFFHARTQGVFTGPLLHVQAVLVSPKASAAACDCARMQLFVFSCRSTGGFHRTSFACAGCPLFSQSICSNLRLWLRANSLREETFCPPVSCPSIGLR
jgi:hypothetical protein